MGEVAGMAERTERSNVLIVDDAPENIHYLMKILQDDYAVTAATSGQKALRMAVAEPVPDVILLDIMMPEMDGFEVCRRLKADTRTAGIPVIFVTAMSDEVNEQQGLDLGAVDYVTKPFRPGLVKSRVRNHLELKRYRDRLEEMVQERTRELVMTQDATIFGLATLAEYRDPETGNHIKRTQHYVRLLAEQLKEHPKFSDYLDKQTIHLLFKSAPLHDIGKVAIPDAILFKPGPLTDEEFQTVKMHTLYGQNTIISIQAELGNDVASSFLDVAEDIAYSHHEKWDGSGYHGLKGERIPIAGRLMALVDVYDALISKRVYKSAFPHETAVRIITEGDGRIQPGHFDPDVLQAFTLIEDRFRQVALTFAESDEDHGIPTWG
jgi:putative two-component system response regulator